MKNSFDPDVFYDLAEAKLNLDSQNNDQEKTFWGNLGYWSNQDAQLINDYAQACSELARQLADTIDLNQSDTLLDVGFGCGDQLFVWANEYQVKDLFGINISCTQVELAQQRLAHSTELILRKYSKQIFVGGDKALLPNEHDVSSLVNEFDVRVNKIIALDCAYHFQHKQQFLQQCFDQLEIDGVLGLSDLVLNRKPQGWFELYMLRLICVCSQVPYAQLKTQQEYQQNLVELGFEIKAWKDVTTHVFIPFGEWLKSYIPKHPNNGSWMKYRITAFFLAWLAKRKLLAYTLIAVRKPSNHGILNE